MRDPFECPKTGEICPAVELCRVTKNLLEADVLTPIQQGILEINKSLPQEIQHAREQAGFCSMQKIANLEALVSDENVPEEVAAQAVDAVIVEEGSLVRFSNEGFMRHMR